MSGSDTEFHVAWHLCAGSHAVGARRRARQPSMRLCRGSTCFASLTGGSRVKVLDRRERASLSLSDLLARRISGIRSCCWSLTEACADPQPWNAVTKHKFIFICSSPPRAVWFAPESLCGGKPATRHFCTTSFWKTIVLSQPSRQRCVAQIQVFPLIFAPDRHKPPRRICERVVSLR